MYVFRIALLLLLLQCCYTSALGQQYLLFARRYGIEDGLPHRQVNCVMQDRQGFIWGATNGGVVRFDGWRFKIYNKADNGLTGDVIDWVIEDTRGNIWVGRIGHNAWLDILDPRTGKVTHSADYFKDQPIPVSMDDVGIGLPLRMPDGTLVFGGMERRGWLSYHPDQGWKHVVVPDSEVFYPIKATDRGSIWGIRLGPGLKTKSLIELDINGAVLQCQIVENVTNLAAIRGARNENGRFFVAEVRNEAAKLFEVHFDGSRIERSLPGNQTYFANYNLLAHDAVQLSAPLFLDKQGKVLLDLQQQFPELDWPQFLDNITDKEGNVWFGTAFGLVTVELREDHFKRLLYDPNAPGGRGIPCRGLLEKNGNLLVNTEKVAWGRYLLNPRTGAAEKVPGIYSLGIRESADGNVWTDLQMKGWSTVSFGKSAPDGQLIGPPVEWPRPFGGVWCFFEESSERLLLTHNGGISQYNPQTGQHESWPTEPNYPEFDKSIVSYIGRDRSGRIWACSDQGLYELKPGGGVLGRYWPGGTGDHYLPYISLYHFYQDAQGIFWIGTAGGGLIRWDGHQATQILRKNGLLNNVVYAAYEDQHEHLWLPTDYGIVQFDKKNMQVRRTWLTVDGVTNNEFNRISHCQGADGTLYFGGLNGITAFNPDRFYTNTEANRSNKALVVSDFWVMDGASDQLENRTAELLSASGITVQPSDRYLQLEFSMLDFIAQDKVTYWWKLEDVSSDWESLKEPVLRLSGLPSGTHQLHIRAQAADGTLAANELSIQLRVLPPIYLRWWFLLTVVAALALGIRLWLSWRVRAHRQEQERLEAEVERQTATIRSQKNELKRLDEAKSRFFANVSHELRTPLTLILGPISSMLKGKRLEKTDLANAQIAQQHGNQLLQLVNEILDLSKMESGKMVLQERAILLPQFLRRVVSSFESHAELLQILFVYEYRAAPRLRVMADEDKLQKVLNNLLSNALKFTPPHAGGAVSIRVEQVDHFIRIGVHDTGRGIHPDDQPRVFERFFQTGQANAPIEGGTGIGLALCREFAVLMQGKIWVESTPGEGSHFYFEFPVKEVLGIGVPVAPELADAEMSENELLTLIADRAGARTVSEGKILLVEDNDSLRSYVQSVLSDHYEVVGTENGHTALQMLETVQPQLIISDIMMPVMDGFQLLEHLKGEDRWRHIPVIMLTARADIRDKLRALRIGVDDYLLKPFEEEELLVRVENLLQNVRNRAHLDLPDDLAPMETVAPESPEQTTPTISAEDIEWLARLEKVVREMIGDSRLSADWLATKMFVGRNLFYKKVKSLTGLTPNEYVQSARMVYARELLETRACQTVKEAAYTVGLKDVKYFSEQFSKHFGKLPSSYL